METFEPEPPPPPPPSPSFKIHVVATADSPEFALLRWALRRAPVVALDAEWKPNRTHRLHPAADFPPRSFPTVSLLQIACRICRRPSDPVVGDSPVFLVDLLSVPLDALWEPLRDMFESPAVIKLGFRFKQDLIYLSSTFSAQGCDAGFNRVEPFMDITSIYHHLKNQIMGKKHPKDTKSLATVCKEVLNVSLSKELQCSDWSCRPLSEEQILYAAADAYYLLEIFDVFQQKNITEGKSQLCLPGKSSFTATVIGKEIISESSSSNKLSRTGYCEASDMEIW